MSISQLHLKNCSVESRERAGLPSLSPPAVGKCVSRTDHPHGLTGRYTRATGGPANHSRAADAHQPMGALDQEEGRGIGVARVSLLNECCEECSQTEVI